MTKTRLVALDTCALLKLFLDEKPEHTSAVQGLLEDPDNQIVIPAVVGNELVCTAKMRQQENGAPPYVSDAIDAARRFLQRPDLLIAEFDRRAMLIGTELGPRYALKPPDASVLATAISTRCSVLYSYDDKLLKVGGKLTEIKIRKPPPPSMLFNLR